MIFILLLAGLVLSFILAFLSLRDYKGDRDYEKTGMKLRKEQIKGGILLHDPKNIKHYSSYSS